jgi:hypothetical protein
MPLADQLYLQPALTPLDADDGPDAVRLESEPLAFRALDERARCSSPEWTGRLAAKRTPDIRTDGGRYRRR